MPRASRGERPAGSLALSGLVAAAFACGPTQSIERRDPSSSGAGGSVGTTPLPCAVADLFEEKCSECHASQTAFGAPMPLVSWEDLHRPAKSNPSQRVYERVGARIHDAVDPMPPPPRALSEAETALLDTWVGGGAPKGAGSCSGGAGGQGGMAGAGAGGATGGTGGMAGVGGDGGTGAVASDECVDFEFVAHGAQAPADPTGFGIAPGGEHYQCFYFKAPWNDPVQALKVESIIDNTTVIHHWLLYATATPAGDGSSAPCAGVHPDAVLLAGWAPGATEVVMPPGVGMELPFGPNGYLILEVHYNNPTPSPHEDRSGVNVCATTDLRPETATVSWLGTELIAIPPQGPGQAQSTCTPSFMGPITILRSWPHMHKLGTAFKTDILRADGSVEPLVDVPKFDFDYQYGYDTPAVINPGDRLVTTCTFQNPTPATVTFGPRTQDEMCYNFVTAYPAGALTSFGLMARSCGI